MSHRVFALIAVALALASAPTLRASCGSSSCPLDTNALNRLKPGQFAFDVLFQYIDQDQPRIGTRDAEVGEIPGEHHDEVRTINRSTTALFSYAPKERLHLSIAVPYISRDHEHLASGHEHAGRGGLPGTPEQNEIPESWDLDGIGDIVIQGRAAVTRPDPVTQSALWFIGGLKLPTGGTDETNDEGEVAELPVQPGTGTTDGIIGLSYDGGLRRQTRLTGPAGNIAIVPYFVTATYQFRSGDSNGYRVGNEFQLNAGGVYPIGRGVDVLLQLNTRIREKDEIDDQAEEARTHADAEPLPEEDLTGGTYVYVSPGLKFSLGSSAVYALVQLPVYQDVNGIQLTSSVNYLAGVQTRF